MALGVGVFGDHDGAVDQHAQSQQHAEHHHEIEGVAKQVDNRHRKKQREGNAKANDQATAEAHRGDNEHHHQRQGGENIALQFADLHRGKLCLVLRHDHLDAAGGSGARLLYNVEDVFYGVYDVRIRALFDADRDGFVISGGGGMVVVEELEHALARGAKIYGEVVGYGATSDGYDMVAPSGEGAVRCMRQAMQGLEGDIDYVNTHGTSTPVGDVKELGAIQEVFGGNSPLISATKAMTGHALGAAGVHEAIYSLLMMENDFVAPSININTLDEKAEGLNIVANEAKSAKLNRVMSNSFGFGGTSATLVIERFQD